MNQTENDFQRRCPLCGGLNRCAVSAGKPVEACWCSATNIPKGLLKRVPAELRGKACICRACIMAYNQAGDKKKG